MVRLYSNENFPLPVVEQLRRLGHDVLTVSEAGYAQQATTDEDVLAFATQAGRAVLTFNRKHFIRLHGLMPGHAGIVVCSFDRDFHALAQRIHACLPAQDDLKGELLRVNRPSLD
jgi:hypothetical protein